MADQMKTQSFGAGLNFTAGAELFERLHKTLIQGILDGFKHPVNCEPYNWVAVYYLTLCLLLITSCQNTQKIDSNGEIYVLDVVQGQKNLVKKNLTDIKSNIRYIQLETAENCLIGNRINKVYVEDNKIFINDNEPSLKVFDANTGKYLYNIGRRGQGPGELPYLSHVDMNVKEKIIVLGWGKILKYNFEGKYLKDITLPNLPASDSTEIIWNNVVILDENLYSVGVYTLSDHQVNAAVIFDEQSNIVSTLKSYDDYIQHHTIKTFSALDQSGFYYKSIDRIHFYRGICDTVYEYNPSTRGFDPYFCFNFGKHRRSRYYDNVDTNNKDEISVQKLSENERFIFIDFRTLKASTEPFEDYFYREGQIVKYVNNYVYAIYDKQTSNFSFLLQPVKGIRGLVNDIDNGLPFWPKYISSKNEFVDYMQAFDFVEKATKITNPDDSFKKLMERVDEEDNPIIIIAY